MLRKCNTTSVQYFGSTKYELNDSKSTTAKVEAAKAQMKKVKSRKPLDNT